MTSLLGCVGAEIAPGAAEPLNRTVRGSLSTPGPALRVFRGCSQGVDNE